jgi:prepilin-type N-terminal cleavage/methylation domain-containing protein
MKKSTQRNQKGFTIIEVVLVLAIAALIFLIVFLAVPALQRNQRDTQRRSDIGRMLTQLQTYASNHGGQLPTTQALLNTFTGSYMTSNGSTFNDPSTGANYTVTWHADTSNTAQAVATVNYYLNATCTNGTLAAANGVRRIAVATQLEASGDYYCVNN